MHLIWRYVQGAVRIMAGFFRWRCEMREQLLAAEKVKAIEWRDGALHLLDQRALPFEETWLSYHSAADVAEW